MAKTDEPSPNEPFNWKGFARKGIKVLSEAADIAVHIRSTTTALGVISLGSRVASSILDMTTVPPDVYFRDWTYVEDFPLEKFLFELLASSKTTTPHAEYRSPNDCTSNVVIARIGNSKIGWIKDSDSVIGPYLPPGVTEDQGMKVIRDFIWDKVGLECRFRKPNTHGPLSLLSDITDPPIQCLKGDNLWASQRPFLENGFRRAILLHGEPGVGKTNIARHIAKKAGGRTLRFQSRDLGALYQLKIIIRILDPDAVIIDDLDRASKPSSVLDDFEDIRASSKLFIVTVNTVSRLDPAVLRRFDDDIEIRSLDHDVLDRLLLGLPEKVRNTLAAMPVTYISQYRAAYDTLGEDLAAEVLQRLVSRRDLVRTLLTSKPPMSPATAHDDDSEDEGDTATIVR